jgi:hypothetical protein
MIASLLSQFFLHDMIWGKIDNPAFVSPLDMSDCPPERRNSPLH